MEVSVFLSHIPEPTRMEVVAEGCEFFEVNLNQAVGQG
jgi:hypothetical protein